MRKSRSKKRSMRKSRSKKRSMRKSRSKKRSMRKSRSKKRSMRKRSKKRSMRKRSKKRSMRKSRSKKRSMRKSRSKKRSMRKSRDYKKKFGFSEHEYVVYTKNGCPWCRKAEELLEKKHKNFLSISGEDVDIENIMRKAGRSDYKYWPKIFHNKKFIGGYTDLEKKLS